MKLFKTFLVLCIFCLHVPRVLAQTLERVDAWNLAYYGHLGVHPGVSISADYFLNIKEELKGKKSKRIVKTWLAVPGVSYYHHFGNQNVFSVSTDFTRRRENMAKRFYRSFGIGPKLIAGFNAGETFEVMDDGSIKKRNLAASYHFAINTNYTIGMKFKSNKVASSLYMTLHSGWMFNYNRTLVPSINLEVGVKRALVKS